MNRQTIFECPVVDPNDTELSRSFQVDEQNFRENYLSDIPRANQAQLDARLTFSSHSLEKSLSNDSFEVGHGIAVAKVLVDLLTAYDLKRYPKSGLAYLNTLAVLKCFHEQHLGSGYQKSIESIFGGLLAEILQCQSQIGGTLVLTADSKMINSTKNFAELSAGRFAVRDYSDEPVDDRLIEDVIRVALKTPSACNRQSARVYYMTDKALIAKVLAVQDGLSHYETPPVLFLVTATDNAYIGPGERNQGYVDGGLFVMSLLYALEFKELAACPLHAMFDVYTRNQIRQMLGISEGEKLITFVSAGHFKPASKVCKSFRYPIDHVAKKIDMLNEPITQSVEIQTDREKDVEIRGLSAELAQAHAELQSHLGIKRSARLFAGNIKRKIRLRTRLRNGVNKARTRNVDGTIVTLAGYWNYGSILQRYALQTFLRNNKFDYVISQHITGPTDPIIVANTKRFCKARMSSIDIDILNPRDMFKSYIVGSDQVWRDWGNEPIEYYFLNHVKNPEAQRIAYAVSFGKDSLKDVGIDQRRSTKLRALAEQFAAISVREASGATLLQREWGIANAAHVLDPTMLLTKEDYGRLIEDPTAELDETHELLVYLLDEHPGVQEFTSNIAHQHQYRISSVSTAFDKQFPPVEQWLKGFRDAKLVITDSFHGMVFSIINNTDFFVVANEARGLARFTSLAELFGLGGRLIRSADLDRAVECLESSEIDWCKVNGTLVELREQSAKWLLNALRDNP